MYQNYYTTISISQSVRQLVYQDVADNSIDKYSGLKKIEPMLKLHSLSLKDWLLSHWGPTQTRS